MIHTHQHGAHEHEHDHEMSEFAHDHGWHAKADYCTGDDTFGVEANPDPPSLDWEPQTDQLLFGPYVGQPNAYLPFPKGRDDLIENVDLSGSQYNYWEMLRRLWMRGKDFIIVEHDIEPPSFFDNFFMKCPQLVCFHDYEVFHETFGRMTIRDKYGGEGGALGCIRFRAELMTAYPRFIENIFDRSWPKLDYQILSGLEALGIKRHRHEPDAIHHHVYT